jgi:hypothetical protein
MSAPRHLLLAVAGCTTMLSGGSAAIAADPGQSPGIGDSIAACLAEAAHRFAIPQAWIQAVMRVESAGDPRAMSPKGAAGLMQIMPSTWDALRVRYGLGTDVRDVHDNIMAGAAYLREMFDRYGSPGFLAAYNAGPGRYEEYLSNGRPLPAETVAYVGKLTPLLDGKPVIRMPVAGPDPLAWMRATLFAGRGQLPSDRDPDASATAQETPSAAPPRVRIAAPEPGRSSLFIPLSGPLSR